MSFPDVYITETTAVVKVQNISNTSKSCLRRCYNPLLQPASDNHWYVFSHYRSVWISGMTCEWNNTACHLSGLAFFQHNNFAIGLCCCLSSSWFFFYYWSGMPVYVYSQCFIHSPGDGHLGCFQGFGHYE